MSTSLIDDAHNDRPDLSVWAQFDESASVVSVPRELHAYTLSHASMWLWGMAIVLVKFKYTPNRHLEA